MVSLKEIIQEFQQTVKELKLKVSDAVIFECAVQRLNATSKFTSFKDLNAPATEPQKDLLKDKGVTIPAGLTKTEADQLIKETLAKEDTKKKGGESKDKNNGSYY